MRDLTDDPTWEDDLTGIGPEEGDLANGEEVSVVGDKMGNRTRWLQAQLLNAYVMIDYATQSSSSTSVLATLTSETPISIGSLAGTVNLAEGDLIEFSTEYGVGVTGVDGGGVLLSHRLSGVPTTFAVIQRFTRLDGVRQQRTWTSYFVAGASEAGAPATVTIRAQLETNGADPSDVINPSVRLLKVWRQVVVP